MSNPVKLETSPQRSKFKYFVLRSELVIFNYKNEKTIYQNNILLGRKTSGFR